MNATGITVALMLLAVVDAGCRHAHAQPSPQITVSTPSAPDASPASPLGGEPMAPLRAYSLVRGARVDATSLGGWYGEPPAALSVPSSAAEATHRCEVDGVAYRCTRQEGFIVSFDLRPPYPMFLPVVPGPTGSCGSIFSHTGTVRVSEGGAPADGAAPAAQRAVYTLAWVPIESVDRGRDALERLNEAATRPPADCASEDGCLRVLHLRNPSLAAGGGEGDWWREMLVECPLIGTGPTLARELCAPRAAYDGSRVFLPASRRLYLPVGEPTCSAVMGEPDAEIVVRNFTSVDTLKARLAQAMSTVGGGMTVRSFRSSVVGSSTRGASSVVVPSVRDWWSLTLQFESERGGVTVVSASLSIYVNRYSTDDRHDWDPPSDAQLTAYVAWTRSLLRREIEGACPGRWDGSMTRVCEGASGPPR